MPFAISKTACKRLFLVPVLLILFILFFYKQIINMYHNVEFTGNVSVAQSAFDLFKRRPSGVCHHIDLLNIGQPDNSVKNGGGSTYPQVVCVDPGFGLQANNCLVLVIRTESDRSLEDAIATRFGCDLHSLISPNVPSIGHNTSLVQVQPLESVHSVDRVVRQLVTTNQHIIDYVLIRTDYQQTMWTEWKTMGELKEVINSIKQMSIWVNLCPAGGTDEDQRFNERHFDGLLEAFAQLTSHGWVLFDVANDEDTFTYNSILKEKTYCASQFAWLNERFRTTQQPVEKGTNETN